MFPAREAGRPELQLVAGVFHAEISSFTLYLVAEGKSARTIRTYTEAAAWFAAEYLLERTGRTAWQQVGSATSSSG